MKMNRLLLFVLFFAGVLRSMEDSSWVPRPLTDQEKHWSIGRALVDCCEKNISDAAYNNIAVLLSVFDKDWKYMNLLGLPTLWQATDQAQLVIDSMHVTEHASFKKGIKQHPLLVEQVTLFFALMRFRTIDKHLHNLVDKVLKRKDFFNTAVQHMHTHEVSFHHFLFLPLHRHALTEISSDHAPLYRMIISLLRLYAQKSNKGKNNIDTQLESIEKQWLQSKIQPDDVYFFRRLRVKGTNSTSFIERCFLITTIQKIHTQFDIFLKKQ